MDPYLKFQLQLWFERTLTRAADWTKRSAEAPPLWITLVCEIGSLGMGVVIFWLLPWVLRGIIPSWLMAILVLAGSTWMLFCTFSMGFTMLAINRQNRQKRLGGTK